MTLLSLCFGLAIFLYAMQRLEQGIQLASGDQLKKWIAERTNHPVSSVGSGIIVTAILQSSSMVSLVALAFVSAGIMPLYNGIGVILGANLGTTVTGWMVTVVGFKLSLQTLVVPLLGIGAALSVIYGRSGKIHGLGIALFAFGLLIFGLDLMKDSVAGLSDVFDLATLKGQPAWVYLLAGMTLAAIMQSSSAVMMITLSLLYSDVVTLLDAAALVIGADLGTTSTTVLGSLGSSIIKKQLAFAHVFFNLVVDLSAFILLLPLLPMYLDFLSIKDPMFGLVAFHSTFNLLGVILFVPALKQYTRWIQRVLVEEPDEASRYFDVPVEVADAALDGLSNALAELNRQAINLHLQELDISPEELHLTAKQLMSRDGSEGSFESRYESLKEFESDLIHYSDRLRHTDITEQQSKDVSQIVESARSLVYASKTLQDIRIDFSQLSNSTGNPMAVELTQTHRTYLVKFYSCLVPLMLQRHDRQYVLEQCEAMREANSMHHQQANQLVTRHLASGDRDLPRVSTWFNLNHELHHYSRYMIAALLAATD